MTQELESSLKSEIVDLRKSFLSVKEISKKKKMSSYAVRTILKEGLGDEYDNYKYRSFIPRPHTYKVIELWKQGNSLTKIYRLTGFSMITIKIILSEKFGEKYNKNSKRLSYKEVKQLAPEKKLKQIIELATSGKNVHEISAISKFPIKFIKSYLKEMVNHHVRFNINEFSGDNFEQVYDAFTLKMIRLKQKSFGINSKSSGAKIIARTTQVINNLKESCIEQYNTIRETMDISSKYMNVKVLGPIFVYRFLKVNGLNFSLHSILPYLQVDKRESNYPLRY